MSDHVHVYPCGDLIEHDIEQQENCVCGPAVEAVHRKDGSNGWLYTHNALDGRELAERGEEILREH